MPANTNPIFILTPNVGRVLINAANLSTDGSGTIGSTIFLAFTPSSNGSRVESVTFTSAQATETLSANTRIAVYVSTLNTGATSSANTYIVAESTLTAVTRSSTILGMTYTFTFAGGLFLPSNNYLLVTSSVRATAANDLSVVTRGGDY